MIKKSEIAQAVKATIELHYSQASAILKRLNNGEMVEGTVALPEHVHIECSGTSAASVRINPADGHVTVRYPVKQAERGRRHDEPVTLNVSGTLAAFGPAAGILTQSIQDQSHHTHFYSPIMIEPATDEELIRSQSPFMNARQILEMRNKLDSVTGELQDAQRRITLDAEHISNLIQMRDGYKARVGELETELADTAKHGTEWRRLAERRAELIGLMKREGEELKKWLSDTQCSLADAVKQRDMLQVKADDWRKVADFRANAIDELKKEMTDTIKQRDTLIADLEAQLAAKPKVEMTVTGAGEVRLNGSVITEPEPQHVPVSVTFVEDIKARDFDVSKHSEIWFSSGWQAVTSATIDCSMVRFYGAYNRYLTMRGKDAKIRVRIREQHTHTEVAVIKATDFSCVKHSHVKFRSNDHRKADHWEQVDRIGFEGGKIHFLNKEGRLVMTRHPEDTVEVKIRG